jgi:ABC-type phosphate transport system substrate-binding protein
MKVIRMLLLGALIFAGCKSEEPTAAGVEANQASGEAEKSGERVVIQNKGSDTLVNVAQAWAEAYAEVDSNVAVAVTGGGSGTGISAMIKGQRNRGGQEERHRSHRARGRLRRAGGFREH